MALLFIYNYNIHFYYVIYSLLQYKLVAQVLFIILFTAPSSGIKFYKELQEFEYNCSTHFPEPKNFDCLCLTGVLAFTLPEFFTIFINRWRIYDGDECEHSKTIGGNNYCTKTKMWDPYVSKFEKIMDNMQQLYFRYKNGSITILSEGIVLNLSDAKEIDSWVTGTSWTVYNAENVPACFSVPEKKYCLFDKVAFSTISKIVKGCGDTMKHIPPEICNDIMENVSNSCEEAETDLNKRKTGRVFFFGPGMKKNLVRPGTDTIDEDDEDYYKKVGSTIFQTPTTSDERVTSIIWNEIHKQLDYILNITVNTTKSDQYKEKPGNILPAYNLLELCAEIMKVSCPSHYVNPYLLDISVKIFNNLLRTQMHFGDIGLEYDVYMRVTKALKNCKNGSSPFNFTKDYLCTDGKIPEGNYNAYGVEAVLYIDDIAVSNKRAPIIETAWKIFYNAHSLCYKYFDETYNDHHRFTNVIVPLFRAKIIQDIWTAPFKLSNMALGGIFGNQNIVQTNLAYCAVSSRLESEYPWDMQRPQHIKFHKRSVRDNIFTNYCSEKDVTHCKTNM